MSLKLPKIHFSLNEWDYKRDFLLYDSAVELLKKITRETGIKSFAFQASLENLILMAKEGRVSEIPNIINTQVDVRALATLFLTDDFYNNCEVTPVLLNALYRPKPVLNTLVVQQLLQLFFKMFEKVGAFDELVLCIKNELGNNVSSLSKSNLAKLVSYKENIISANGPAWVAKQAIKNQIDLDVFIEEIGLSSFSNTKFYSLCQNNYYLEQLKTIKPSVNHPVLQEIIKPTVYESPYNQTEMLGHEILRVLIDRSPEEGVDEQWQAIILTIAGDPRVPKSSQKYRRWWIALSASQIQKVKGWLSRFDLLLFLKVLESYGEMNEDESINRMFPARKKFMEGLFDLGLVEDSRLFVNHRTEHYLKENYKKSELPVYANINDHSNRSMIYLKVSGKHMIEGTHNFKFWLFDDLPNNNKLQNYDQIEFVPEEITTELKKVFIRQYGDTRKPPVSISHVIGWQHKVIEAFKKLGVYIDPEKVLSTEDYINYKRRYGMN